MIRAVGLFRNERPRSNQIQNIRARFFCVRSDWLDEHNFSFVNYEPLIGSRVGRYRSSRARQRENWRRRVSAHESQVNHDIALRHVGWTAQPVPVPAPTVRTIVVDKVCSGQFERLQDFLSEMRSLDSVTESP